MLEAYSGSLPPALSAAGPLDEARWAQWLTAEDRATRQRLERGEEDTLSNLLRFGITFTKEYRITDDYLPKFGESSLVNSFAENRANDLLRALASPSAAEGLQEMRAFLASRGYALDTAAARARTKKYLLDNLARLRDDFQKAHSEEARRNRSTEFSQRGISLDTNLWPDYDLDFTIRQMIERGWLTPDSVRRVAIVGPGLDFVNKQQGFDFYPPQTIQPFAVIDSLARLGLSGAESIEVTTIDISSKVNVHVERTRGRGRAGQPYTLQLAWDAADRWSDQFRRAFVDYWTKLGDQIGTPVKPLPLPEAAEGIQIRAVQVRPAVAARITPLDLNIVYQRTAPPSGQAFDLVIATNMFIYYGEFEQSLARANVAAMLKPGGFLITNDKLPEKAPGALEAAFETQIPMTGEPVVIDSVYCYRRR